MFNKLKSVKAFSNEKVSLEQLVKIVQNNPQKDLIEKIRSVPYKSTEYNNLKLKVNCITPHGVFNSLCNDGLVSLSNYLYYDIDGFDTINELNDTKNRLIDTFPISFLCKSVGGKGISFFIKINDTTNKLNDTFLDVYCYVRKMLIDLGFNIDIAAGGLVRKMIISSDENVYVNDTSLLVDDTFLGKCLVKESGNVKSIGKKKEDYYYTVNDTLIEYKELIKEIKLEVKYTKEIVGDYVIDDLDYYKIIIPERIKDGDKHRVYVRTINALYYINPSITRIQVYSFINYINNNNTTIRMNQERLKSIVNYICDGIESTGEVGLKTRKKKIHFNTNNKMTKNEKQSMAAKILNKERGKRTVELIESTKLELIKKNIIPTQKMVVERTGLSIATVKRNWNKKDYNDNTIEIEKENDSIPLIEEDLFFNEPEHQKENITQPAKNMKEYDYNWKGIEKVKLVITNDDKIRFKEMVESLKPFPPSEQSLLDFGWCKYKTTFLYQRWIDKNKDLIYGDNNLVEQI